MSKQYLVTVPDSSILANTTNALIFDAPATERDCRRVKPNVGLVPRDDLERELKASREAGRDEVWKLLGAIYGMPYNERLATFDTPNYQYIWDLGYAEASKRYEKYIKQKEWEARHRVEINVGDVVLVPDDTCPCDPAQKAFVTRVEGDILDLVYLGGGTTYKSKNDVFKTDQTVDLSSIRNWLREEE